MDETATSDVPWCECDLPPGRAGFTRINEYNDFGCGNCRKPMKMYHERVVAPRERRAADANT